MMNSLELMEEPQFKRTREGRIIAEGIEPVQQRDIYVGGIFRRSEVCRKAGKEKE